MWPSCTFVIACYKVVAIFQSGNFFLANVADVGRIKLGQWSKPSQIFTI